MRDAQYWIEKLGLARHPEGGYYREVYRSPESIAAEALPGRYEGARVLATSIYFLLPGSQVSRLHRLCSDELWHYYAGSALTIHVISRDGEYKRLRLGADFDRDMRAEDGMRFQATVEKGSWFGATVDDADSYTLVGCTVAPGFEYADFVLGDRDALLGRYPQHREIIERLT